MLGSLGFSTSREPGVDAQPPASALARSSHFEESIGGRPTLPRNKSLALQLRGQEMPPAHCPESLGYRPYSLSSRQTALAWPTTRLETQTGFKKSQITLVFRFGIVIGPCRRRGEVFGRAMGVVLLCFIIGGFVIVIFAGTGGRSLSPSQMLKGCPFSGQ